MSESHVERWLPEAEALAGHAVTNPGLPFGILLNEASLAADFVDVYWEPGAKRRGLSETAQFLPKSVAEEIRSLSSAAHTLNARVVLNAKDDPQEALMEQGREMAGELNNFIRFVLDDGAQTAGDAGMAVIRQRDASLNSPAELAQLLADLAVVAEHERATLMKLPSFKPELIANANALAEQLLQCTRVLGRRASADIALRDRMLTLLGRRVAGVRRMARFVFRDRPDILRQVTSRYERRRRAASSAKNADDNAPADA